MKDTTNHLTRQQWLKMSPGAAAIGLAGVPIGCTRPPVALDHIIRLRLDHLVARISPGVLGHLTEPHGRNIYDGIWVGEDSPILNQAWIRLDSLEALGALSCRSLARHGEDTDAGHRRRRATQTEVANPGVLPVKGGAGPSRATSIVVLNQEFTAPNGPQVS